MSGTMYDRFSCISGFAPPTGSIGRDALRETRVLGYERLITVTLTKQERHRCQAELAAAMGSVQVATHDDDLQLYSQDVYRSGAMPIAVVRPQTVDQLSRAVRVVAGLGLALFPRGGGMSYTDAFLPTTERSIVLDMSALSHICEINADDLYVVVEAGTTWSALDEVLSRTGMRARFWGPGSGLVATIGGACSQGAVAYGSGRHGVSARSVLGFEIVNASGERLFTGSAGQRHSNGFFRNYGPDLTGLFTGDGGALGIKATVTLEIEPRPSLRDGLSFGFSTFSEMRRSIAGVARDSLAGEIFGMEASLLRMIVGDQTLRDGIRTLGAVARAESNRLTGLLRAGRLALGGRQFMRGSDYVVNVITEADDPSRMRALKAEIRQRMGDGREITSTVPNVVRATPFPTPGLLGPQGRRVLPSNGIFPMSMADRFFEAFDKWRGDIRQELSDSGIELHCSFSGVGRNSLLIEPLFYWRDSWPALHRRTMGATALSGFTESSDNPRARAIVGAMRTHLLDLMYSHGAVHLQIGRLYPYLRDRDPQFIALARGIKGLVDPHNLINPGVLGL